jgi:hypothetical protein
MADACSRTGGMLPASLAGAQIIGSVTPFDFWEVFASRTLSPPCFQQSASSMRGSMLNLNQLLTEETCGRTKGYHVTIDYTGSSILSFLSTLINYSALGCCEVCWFVWDIEG